MSLPGVRRMAADILGVGEGRIRFKPDSLARIRDAITRQDVRDRIRDDLVYALPVKGRRKKERHGKRKAGSRKGSSGRLDKEEWMKKVRSQRRYLREMVAGGQLDRPSKRIVYTKIKSGIFRSRAALRLYLEENHMLLKTEGTGEELKKELPQAEPKKQTERGTPS